MISLEMFNKNMFWNHHLKVVFRFVQKINLSIFEIRISLKEKRGNSRENPLQTKKIREGTGSSLDQGKMKLQGTLREQDGLSLCTVWTQEGEGSGAGVGGHAFDTLSKFYHCLFLEEKRMRSWCRVDC